MSNYIKKKGKPSFEKPWLKYYSQEALEMSVSTDTLFEYLLRNNRSYPLDIAILFQNIKITYKELFKQIDDCTKALLALGVRRNDVVTIAMVSVPEVIYLVFAINRIGAIANFIHPLSSVEDTCHNLREVNSRLCFALTGNSKWIHKILTVFPLLNVVAVSPVHSLPRFYRLFYYLKNIGRIIKPKGNIMSWDFFIKQGIGRELPHPQRADRDYALISHTSGTTGVPKCVVCTNENILAVIQQSVVDRPHKRQECMMSVLPPFINYSLVNSILEPLCCGLKTLIIPNYQPEKMVDYINRFHVNHIISIPAYWKIFLSIPHVERNDFSQLGFICSGGDSLDVSVEREVNRIIKKCGGKIELMKGTGMTETTSVVASTYPYCNPEGSVGIPCVKNTCKIIDLDSGEELGYGETGEICFTGPTVMAGYYQQPYESSDIIHTEADGTRWVHTGDIGYICEDGVIFIVGRIKRIIMQSDEYGMVSKIIPERIERVIASCDGVDACCVVGIRHTQRINTLKAFVVPKKNCFVDEREKLTLLKQCQEKLPSYMVPQEIEFINKLAQTAQGKVDYRSLEGNKEPIVCFNQYKAS